LRPFKEFVAALQDKTAEIQSFENLFLDQSDLDVARVSTQLAHLIQALEIVDNRMKIVPGTKALHHLLPDLVVPMDREYTQQFFGWHNPQFQNYPERRFAEAFASFVAVAQITNPVQYLKSGWYSSRTKVIDNAVVGLCCGLKLQWDPTASFGSIDPLNDTPPGCVLPKKIGTRITYSVGSVPVIITNSLAPRSGVARGARPRVLRGRGPSVVRSSTADHC